MEIYSEFRFFVGEETIFFRQMVGQFSQSLYIYTVATKIIRQASINFFHSRYLRHNKS